METYFKNMLAEEGTKEKLVQDLLTLVHDAEDLIRSTGGSVADKSREELMAGLAKLKVACKKVEDRAAASSRAAEQMIRQHPYPSIGIALGVGLLIGVLTGRK